MSQRFLRLDLSPAGRDFEHVAVEPGLPLLDGSKTNDRCLRKWLGRFAAEAEWNHQTGSIDLYVRDDDGARPHDVRVEPATLDEVRRDSKLSRDLAEMQKRLEKVQPLASEVKLYNAVVRLLEKQTGAAFHSHFFKVHERNNVRLVWAWGYQRKDAAPALPIICDNPECSLLHARRANQPANCPACGRVSRGPASRSSSKLPWLVTSLIILAVGAFALRDLWKTPDKPNAGPVAVAEGPQLKATPSERRIPVGGRAPYKVVYVADGKEEDVTHKVVAVVDDPRVARLAPVGATIQARAQGKTVVHFHLADRQTSAVVEVEPATTPAELTLTPSQVTLGIGTTTQLKATGKYADGREIDLTDAVEWLPSTGRVVSGQHGFLEGQTPGKDDVLARYRASPSEAYLTAGTPVTVVEEEYRSLDLNVAPAEIAVGQSGVVDVAAVNAAGERRSLVKSSQAKLAATGPAELRDGNQLVGLAVGRGKLTAAFGALSQTRDFTIGQPPAASTFEVQPKDLRLIVGEVASLVTTSGDGAVSFTTSDPSIVELRGDSFVVGRRPGKAEITAARGEAKAVVVVEVEPGDVRSIAFAPARVSVGVNDTATVRLVARVGVAAAPSPPVAAAAPNTTPTATTGEASHSTTPTTQPTSEATASAKAAPTSEATALATGKATSEPASSTEPTERDADLVPDVIVWERMPLASFAELDVDALQIRGRQATGEEPQIGVARVGEHRAQLLVDVVDPPAQLELAPAGPLKLPIGTATPLQVWATRGDGQRSDLATDHVEWKLSPGETKSVRVDAASGFVHASADPDDATPASVTVTAAVHGNESNGVTVEPIAAPLKLALQADRELVAVNDVGRVSLAVTADGDNIPATLELSSPAEFTSSDPSVLAVDSQTGAYRAVAAGKAVVNARHPLAPTPAELAVEVHAANLVKLEFRPSEAVLLVGGRQALELVRIVGETVEPVDTVAEGDAVHIVVAQPEAVLWEPPILTGVVPAEPFLVTAEYQGLSAQATITVKPAEQTALRVQPARVQLNPGQPFSPVVEQRAAGMTETWQEIDPGSIEWKTPDAIALTPASGSARPQVTPKPDAKGSHELTATYSGMTATLTVDVSNLPAPNGPLVVVREPTGESLAVGDSQRYTIMVQTPTGPVPATNVVWPENFENDAFVWESPTLTAKQPRRTQRLTAKVGEQETTFSTRSVGEGLSPSDWDRLVRDRRGARSAASRQSGARLRGRAAIDVNVSGNGRGGTVVGPGGAIVRGSNVIEDLPGVWRGPATHEVVRPVGPPSEVRIVANQPTPIAIPVRSRFANFHIEAVYPNVAAVDVTREANLSLAGATSPITAAIEGRFVVGREPGRAEVFAEYRGVRSTAGIPIEVTPGVDAQSLVVSPSRVELRVGESLALSATAFAGERVLGDVTARADVRWRSEDESIARAIGNTIQGVRPGRTSIVASIAGATGRTEVTVLTPADAAASSQPLAFRPDALRVRVGETVQLGRDVNVLRNGLDVSGQSEASSSDSAIVRVRDARTLEAVAPGRADVVVTYSGQTGVLPVFVEAASGPAPAQMIVQETDRVLAIGEHYDVTAFVQMPDGRRLDVTAQTAFQSSNPSVLAINGRRAIGLAPGDAAVTGTRGGVPQDAVLRFRVVDEPFTELIVVPGSLTLAPGERRAFDLIGVGPRGRHSLIAASGMTTSIGGATPGAIDVIDSAQVRGLSPGQATFEVKWRGLASNRVTVNVSDAAPTGLRIAPPSLTLGLGERTRLAVFVQYGEHERPLSIDDEVAWQTADSGVAEAGPAFTVAGLSPGATEVVARFGSLRAVAPVTVTARTAMAPAPSAAPVGLRFMPEVITIPQGVPTRLVRLMRELADAHFAPLQSRPTLTVSEPDVLDAVWTANGLELIGKKPGQALVSAAEGDLKSIHSLLVSVADPASNPARLEAAPFALTLNAGATTRLRDVRLVQGGESFSLGGAYRLESGDASIVAVEAEQTLRAVKPGRAEVTVVPTNVAPAYADLRTRVAVTVTAAEVATLPPAGQSPTMGAGARLILSGPTRATVGAQVSYRVELVRNIETPGRTESSTWDATAAGAALVLEGDSAGHGEALPGCVVAARSAGSVVVRARFREWISNPITLRVDPPATSFASLELGVDRSPLSVGEVRPYTLWGHPQGGGPRQDLTGLVSAEVGTAATPVVTLRPLDAATPAATHRPPTITAVAPGRFEVSALLGSGLRTAPIELEVLAAPSETLALRASPVAATVRVGERAPPIEATVVTRTGELRRVDAQWTSADEKILAPDATSPGRFIGKSPGKTQLEGQFNGQSVSVEVTVAADAFQQVAINPQANFQAQGKFTVTVDVVGDPASGGVEYRVVAGDVASDWKAPRSGTSQVTLTSPALTVVGADAPYQMLLEARDAAGRTIARYPVSFRLASVVRQAGQPNAVTPP